MKSQNTTHATEFLLLGLSEDAEMQPLLSGLFLSMYFVTIVGNLLIILAISSDFHLHTPMYFFLSILSLDDIFFTSTTIPKMIVDIQMNSRVISYVGCLTQMSFSVLFACLDSLILSVMAYDRFVAVCHPLRYPVIMNPCLCSMLLLLSIFSSILDSQLHSWMVSQLTFFTVIEIPHFFCDPSQLINIACFETPTNNILIYFLGAIFGGVPLSGILYSYARIVSSILTVPTSGGKYKAFSTCSSHLSVICLFYGTGIGVYFSSVLSPSPWESALASVTYTIVTPMLNPFIYGLRNKDIKRALLKILSRPT
ncbi:olfactory receptor 7E24-like [Choloepus didactylus]|uniref:olfactory receptor 7E24-like n=1 Tax=Choloepus didactylus TaxID=27675 RepID=UPI00189E9428|nr:olfactory receptor 7E24-like [Choloepus didactylus]